MDTQSKEDVMASWFFKKNTFFFLFVSNLTGCFPSKKISPFLLRCWYIFSFSYHIFIRVRASLTMLAAKPPSLFTKGRVCIYRLCMPYRHYLTGPSTQGQSRSSHPDPPGFKAYPHASALSCLLGYLLPSQESQGYARQWKRRWTDDTFLAFMWRTCKLVGKLPEEEVTQGREWKQVIWAQDRSAGVWIPGGTEVSKGSSGRLRSSPSDGENPVQVPG